LAHLNQKDFTSNKFKTLFRSGKQIGIGKLEADDPRAIMTEEIRDITILLAKELGNAIITALRSVYHDAMELSSESSFSLKPSGERRSKSMEVATE